MGRELLGQERLRPPRVPVGTSPVGDVGEGQPAVLEVLQEGRHQARERIDPALLFENVEHFLARDWRQGHAVGRELLGQERLRPPRVPVGTSPVGDVGEGQPAVLEVLQKVATRRVNGSIRPCCLRTSNTFSRGIGDKVTTWAASFSVRLRSSLPSACSWLKVSIRMVPCAAWTSRFQSISRRYCSRSTYGAVLPAASIPKCSM